MPEIAAREPTYSCEWCGKEDLHEDQIVAYRPRSHAVMTCEHCCPEPAAGEVRE